MDTHISQWLKKRQTTLVLCHKFAHAKETKKVSFEEVASFCQALMDYVAHGHFSVHEKLVKAALTHKVPLDTTLLEKIEDTTQEVQAFNDKYTEPTHLEEWFDDLSHLAERLAHRMAWEQVLMQPYLDSMNIKLSH